MIHKIKYEPNKHAYLEEKGKSACKTQLTIDFVAYNIK